MALVSFTLTPSSTALREQVVNIALTDNSFVDGGDADVSVVSTSNSNNQITVNLTHDGVVGSARYVGSFTVKDSAIAVTDEEAGVIAVEPGTEISVAYGTDSTTFQYNFDPNASIITLGVTPSFAWGKDKAVTIKVFDTAAQPTDVLQAVVYEEGASPANSTTVSLTYQASTGGFVGTVYLTNDLSSSATPRLTVTDDALVQVTYGGKTATVQYTLEAPKENGYFVEVRSSVRNLHWDVVTILTKAGWKFVETLPPTVDTNGYVTNFKHILKTTTTPRDVDGQPMSVEMFLLIEHKNYPGNNSGNYRELTFKLSPNYYYHDRNVIGRDPDSGTTDILYTNGSGVSKVLEYPTLPVDLMFAPLVTGGNQVILDIPVNIWGYVSRDYFSLIFQGEPSISTDGFGQVSHVYGGMIDSFKEGKLDIGGNFALAGSANTTTSSSRYGANTSDGVSSIAMYRTYGGLLWQKHFASVIQDDPQGDSRKSELYQPSAWTGKFHLSPVYVFHPTDGKRGYLKGTLAVQKQGILHLDELEIIRPVDECAPCPVDSNNEKIDPNDVDHPEYATAWKREKYKYYRLTNLQHFLRSFNTNDQYDGIGVAIKMETDTDKVIKFNTSYDIVTGGGVSSWTGIGAVPEGAELAGARTSPISMGSVQLVSGGNAVYSAPSFTGDVSKFEVTRNPQTDAPEYAVVEILVNEDPGNSLQFDASVESTLASEEKFEIQVSMTRQPSFDVPGKYAFRGVFYLTQASGGTNPSIGLLQAGSGDTLKVTYGSITGTITV